MTIRKLSAQPLSRRLRWYVRLLDTWSGYLYTDDPASMRGIPLSGGIVSTEGLLKLIRQDASGTRHAHTAAVSLERLQAGCSEANELRRAIDALRHALVADLPIHQPADAPFPAETAESDTRQGLCFPGTAVLAEELRSPYNTGSIIRSAEAFGMERCTLVGSMVDPDHPRLLRAAMGAQRHVRVERFTHLDQALSDTPVFALETGGTPVSEFVFPERGIVLLGHEQFGLSEDALAHARSSAGIVSIPLYGAKGSLNVATACATVLSWWTSRLAACGNPVPRVRGAG